MDEKINNLIAKASEHIRRSYVVDRTTIAAAALSNSGVVYTGLNYKYRIRNITMCAERMAIFKALEAGEELLELIVGVKYFPNIDRYEIQSPCGECRQVEIYYPLIKTIIKDNDLIKIVSVDELLPYSNK